MNTTPFGIDYNSDTNVTDSLSSDQEWACTLNRTYKLTSLVVVTVLAPTTLFGNILILVSLLKYRRLFKGSLFMFIGNLAVADIFLAVGLLMHVTEVVFITFHLEHNVLFCAFKTAITTVSLFNSGITLMFMSMDRFLAVVYPMHHFLKSNQTSRIRNVIFGIWIMSLVLGFVPTMAGIDALVRRNVICRFGACLPNELLLTVAVLVLFQILFNCVLCFLVACHIRRNTSHMTPQTRKRMNSKSCLLLEIYIIFAICWLPSVLSTVMINVETSIEKQRELACKREYLMFFGLFNSGINWIIYGLANKKFRKIFKHLLCCAIINLSERPSITPS